MLPTAEKACFLIGDISGYTSYLAGVELEHAQDIIADLMENVVKCLRPPFRLAKFEGDAAFLCAAGDRFDGSLIQDAMPNAPTVLMSYIFTESGIGRTHIEIRIAGQSRRSPL